MFSLIKSVANTLGQTVVLSSCLDTGRELRQLFDSVSSSCESKATGLMSAPKTKQAEIRMPKLAKTHFHDPNLCRTQAAKGVIVTEPTLLPIRLAVRAKLCLVVKW